MKDSDNNKKNLISSVECGLEFVLRIAVGVAIGVFLDKISGKSPLFLIVFFIFGCVAGYFNLLKCAENYRDKKTGK